MVQIRRRQKWAKQQNQLDNDDWLQHRVKHAHHKHRGKQSFPDVSDMESLEKWAES